MASYNSASPSLLSACFSDLNDEKNPVPLSEVNAVLTRIETLLALPAAFLSQDPLIRHNLGVKIDTLGRKTGLPAHELTLLETDILEIIVDLLADIKVVDSSANRLYGTFRDPYSVYQDNQQNLIYKELLDLTDDDDDIDDTESLMEIRSRHLRKHSSPVSVDFEEQMKTEDFGAAKQRFSPKGSFCVGDLLDQIEDHYVSVEQSFSVVEIKLDSLKTQSVKDRSFLRNLQQSNDELGERLRLIRHELEMLQNEINGLKRPQEEKEAGGESRQITSPMSLPVPPLAGLGLQIPTGKRGSGTTTFTAFLILATILTVIISYLFKC